MSALSYIDRYQGNVLALERERPLLCSALAQAWRQEHYAHVVQLMTGLIYLVGRGDAAEGERMLLWGIEASRQVHDRRRQAYFLHRLAGLLCTCGRIEQGWLAWQESQEIGRSLGYAAFLWEPLCQVAHIADLLDGYEPARAFADMLLQAPQVDHPYSVLVALFLRGFYARLRGDTAYACNDFRSCLHLLPSHSLSGYEHFFLMEVQAELARAEGDYPRSLGYANAALSLARTFCEPYTVTALLLDQILFASRQGMLEDARSAAVELLAYAELHGIQRHALCGELLLRNLDGTSSNARAASTMPAQLLAPEHDQALSVRAQLSPRELDVLRYVARGYSNREIADRLTITVGTVKKHLEHISIKLDAYSRTHAVARARELQLLA